MARAQKRTKGTRSSKRSKVTARKTTVAIPVPRIVAAGIRNSRVGLGQAQDLLEDLRDRGSREIESLRDRVGVAGLARRARGLETRSRLRAAQMADELARRAAELQDSILAVVGLASREQIEELSREVSRLRRKVDAVAGARGGAKRTPSKTGRSPRGAARTRNASRRRRA